MSSVPRYAPRAEAVSANGHTHEAASHACEATLEALGDLLSVKDVLPLILRSVSPMVPQDDDVDLYRALHAKLAELTGLVMQFRDPGAAEAYALRLLPRKFDFACELLYGKRKPVIGSADAERLALLEIVSGGRDHS
jgi:hypothetical protein